MKKTIIGITGAMGCGKSTVAKILWKSAGSAIILDADKIAKKFLRPGSRTANEIAKFFPDAVTGGKISTEKLAEDVFSSKKKLSYLNSLLHPLVERAIRQKLEKSREKVIILDVPLLLETGMQGIADVVIIVNAKKSAIVKRSKFRKYDINRRTSMQMSFAKKKLLAIKSLGEQNVFVIDNSDSIDRTKKDVMIAWNTIKKRE